MENKKELLTTDFILRRVMSDGDSGGPEVVGIEKAAVSWKTDRRGFLGAAAAALASLGLAGKKARAQQKETNAPARMCHQYALAYHGRLSGIIISPDGKRCVATSRWSDGSMTRLWELPGGRLMGRFKGEGLSVLSPDGKVLAYPAVDGSIHLVNTADGIETAALRGHKQAIVRLAVSPDGTLLASASSQEMTVRLWSLPDGKPRGVLAGHTKKVYWLDFTPDGKRLVSTGLDRTVRVWSMPGGQSAVSIKIPDPYGINFESGFVPAPDGEHLMFLMGGGKRVIWKLSTGEETHRVLPLPRLYADRWRQADRGNAVVFSSDGRRILLYNSARAGGEAMVREYPGGAVLAVFTSESKSDHAVRMAFLPDGNHIVTARAGYRGELTLWKIDPPAGLVSRGDTGWVRKLYSIANYGDNFAVSPDRTFVVAGADGRLALFSLPEMNFVECFFDHEELSEDRKVRVAEFKNERNETIYRVIPEKGALPAGAVCACDTVSGMRKSSGGGPGGSGYCTCNRVCTCVPVK